jgi:hypothetical protein
MSDQALEQSQPSVEDRMLALVSDEPPQKEEAEQEAAPQENEQEVEEAQAEESEPEGDEQPEAEEPEATEAELVEIDVDGETYQVPEVLKDKFMLQADYTRKTQEVAEQRKQVELAQAQLQQAAQLQQQSIAEYAELTALDKQIQQYNQVDWNALYESDPAEFVRLKEQSRDLRDTRSHIANQIQLKHQQQYEQNLQARIQLKEEGLKVLTKEIPNWNADLGKTISHYAIEKFGFTASEMNEIIDPRVVKVLYTAYQRDKQVTNKPITDKRVANLPKVSKPGGNNKPSVAQSREADARKALKKTGSMDAAQALFLARLSN